jgi:UDP-glucose 4-epimerase
MRIAVVGATGNIGFHLVRELVSDPRLEEVVAIARRLPEDRVSPRVRWLSIDVARSDAGPALEDALRGCQAVVHLAWLIQPERASDLLAAANVDGSARVFAAARSAGVPAIVYSSSVGAYAAAASDQPVDESWPATGVPASLYSRQKAAVERILDDLEHTSPDLRVARLRPAFVLSGAAAASQGRYFVGPLVPRWLLRRAGGDRGHLPVAPAVPGLTVQVVHSRDAARAFAAAATGNAHGAFNIAASPPISPKALAETFGARGVPVPAGVVRAAVAAAYRLRLTPVSRGWIELALAVPVMNTERAERQLGWRSEIDAESALREWLAGLVAGRGARTPVLRPAETWLAQVRGGARALTARSGGRI